MIPPTDPVLKARVAAKVLGTVEVYLSLSHLLNELGNEIERLRLALVEATTRPDNDEAVVIADARHPLCACDNPYVVCAVHQ